MINQIKIRNFRCIEDMSFRPKAINIFVGRNNTGKSSILYAIATAFFRQKAYMESHQKMKYLVRIPQKKAEIDIDSDNVTVKTMIFNDFEEIPEQYKKEIYIHLKNEMQTLLSKFKKNLSIDTNLEQLFSTTSNIIKSYTITFIHEYLSDDDKSKKHLITVILDPAKYKEAQAVFEKEFKLPETPKERVTLRFFVIRRIFDTLQIFKIGDDTDFMKKTNLNFYTDIKSEIETDEKTLLALEDILREKIFPNLKRLGKDSVVLGEELLEHPIEIYGDGLKTILAVLKLLYASKNGILLLEEPENHLHRGYTKLLIKYLIEYSEKLNVQLFISTHNMDLLEELLKYKELDKKLQIIRMSKDELKGKISFETLNYNDAKEEEEMKLDLRGV